MTVAAIVFSCVAVFFSVATVCNVRVAVLASRAASCYLRGDKSGGDRLLARSERWFWFGRVVKRLHK